MKHTLRLTLAAACAVLAAAPALAQTGALRTERTLTLELASQIATSTVAACQAKGYAVSAAVVDRAGNLRVLLRADNAGPHTIESARQKAFTSASARNNTQAMMEGAQKNPGAANLVHLPGFLLLVAACRCARAMKWSALSVSGALLAGIWTSSAPWRRSMPSRISSSDHAARAAGQRGSGHGNHRLVLGRVGPGGAVGR